MSEHSAEHPAEEQTAVDNPRIAAAMAQLDRLADADLGQHPEIFDGVHGELREVLANAGRHAGAVRPAGPS